MKPTAGLLSHDSGAASSLIEAHAAAGEDQSELPGGWELAKNWRKLGAQLPAPLRRKAREAAIDAILRRARDLLRHAARPVALAEHAWPGPGELDLERSLEAGFLGVSGLVRPEQLRLTQQSPRALALVTILDMSLSMTGEKVALIAVAVAILRLKLEKVGVVVFDTTAHRLVGVEEELSPREVVRRVLEVPAQGYTNIEAGLERALIELRSGRERDRVGLLLTDGLANVGRNPVPVARRFPRLHVVHLGDHHPQGARCCREMAQEGHGRIYRATRYADLPGVVRRAVRELFRG